MPNDPRWAPEPPVELPPGYVVHVRRRGELFVRDTGGDGQPVLLLHGWMFSADLNFWRNYGALEAGYRVLAIDHRGHGRGIRSHAKFRLADCAADAAALLRQLDLAPALVVGYSMGGPVAQLMARDHADTVAGIVLCATSSHWSDLRQQLLWRSLALVRLSSGSRPTSRGATACAWPASRTTRSPSGRPPSSPAARRSTSPRPAASCQLGLARLARGPDVPAAVVLTPGTAPSRPTTSASSPSCSTPRCSRSTPTTAPPSPPTAVQPALIAALARPSAAR